MQIVRWLFDREKKRFNIRKGIGFISANETREVAINLLDFRRSFVLILFTKSISSACQLFP